MGKTGIAWTDETWNPTKGCRRVSPGCQRCYAEQQAARIVRMRKGKPSKYDGLVENVLRATGETADNGEPEMRLVGRWTGAGLFDPETLALPLRWSKPRRIFVDSMSDLFFETFTNEQIAAVFGVMAACPQHTFQVLTKRPKRMREWFARDGVVEEVERFRQMALAGRVEEFFAAERVSPVAEFPEYFITSRGRVLSSAGREFCAWCGEPNAGDLRKKFCSLKCKSKANYEIKCGRWIEPDADLKEMSPDAAEQGHMRVQFYANGQSSKLLVHRLVLAAFDRSPRNDEQGCHIDGDAKNNALWNLRWGSQSDNWDDRKRHGNRRSYAKVTAEQVEDIRHLAANGENGAEIGRRFGISDTQARNIIAGRQWAPEQKPVWPLPGVWLGVSVENQDAADERIPELLATPAALHFLSCEPLLGPVDLTRIRARIGTNSFETGTCLEGNDGFGLSAARNAIGWVITGSESGPGARQQNLDWYRSLRDQCAAADVAFFLKQADEHALDKVNGPDGAIVSQLGAGPGSWRKGKTLIEQPYLDGVQHIAFPEVCRD